MQQNLDEIGKKNLRLNETLEEVHYDEDTTYQNLNNGVEEIISSSMSPNYKGKGVVFSRGQLYASNTQLEFYKKTVKNGSSNQFMPRTTVGAQSSLKSVLQSKEVTES
jgi:hypothetical protein